MYLQFERLHEEEFVTDSVSKSVIIIKDEILHLIIIRFFIIIMGFGAFGL